MYVETKELIVTTAPRTGRWQVLAHAIRRGCQQTIQHFGGAWKRDPVTREIYTACAMGAAVIGGWNGTPYSSQPLRDGLDCPVECGEWMFFDMTRLVQHLNDQHRWTREAIADWLDTL